MKWPRFLSWLAPLLLAGAVWLSPAHAQAPAQPTAQGTESIQERRPPAGEYIIAALSTMLILVIVCMPTRKQ